MSGAKQTLLGTLRVVLAALPLLAGSGVAAAERDAELVRRLEAIVQVHAEIPPEARTAAYLGRRVTARVS